MSVKARQSIGRLQRTEPIDAVFAHTQVVAVLLGRWMRMIPMVVSVDATPEQYDTLGEFYRHRVGTGARRALQEGAQLPRLRRAEHVVTWSVWARDGVIDGYGVPAGDVTVIPPGVDVARWQRRVPRVVDDQRPVRILFVGGDLVRKGGDLLLRGSPSCAPTATCPPSSCTSSPAATSTSRTASPCTASRRTLPH